MENIELQKHLGELIDRELKQKKIQIFVSGGCIEQVFINVEGMDISIEVIDYDIESFEPDMIEKDSEGNEFAVYELELEVNTEMPIGKGDK